jgi:hypothetical protein
LSVDPCITKNKMSANKIFKYGLTQILILTVIFFLTFSKKENGDMNVVIFITFLYIPYLLLFTTANMCLIIVGLNYLKTGHLKWLTVFLSTTALTIWFFISNGQIVFYNWKIEQTEFISINIILCIINFLTVSLLTNKTNKTNKTT